MLHPSYDSYCEAHVRKNAKPLNKKPLMTDRNAYMGFLEGQLERVSEACRTSSTFDHRLTETSEHTMVLEERIVSLTKLVSLANHSADAAAARVNDQLLRLESLVEKQGLEHKQEWAQQQAHNLAALGKSEQDHREFVISMEERHSASLASCQEQAAVAVEALRAQHATQVQQLTASLATLQDRLTEEAAARALALSELKAAAADHSAQLESQVQAANAAGDAKAQQARSAAEEAGALAEAAQGGVAALESRLSVLESGTAAEVGKLRSEMAVASSKLTSSLAAQSATHHQHVQRIYEVIEEAATLGTFHSPALAPSWAPSSSSSPHGGGGQAGEQQPDDSPAAAAATGLSSSSSSSSSSASSSSSSDGENERDRRGEREKQRGEETGESSELRQRQERLLLLGRAATTARGRGVGELSTLAQWAMEPPLKCQVADLTKKMQQTHEMVVTLDADLRKMVEVAVKSGEGATSTAICLRERVASAELLTRECAEECSKLSREQGDAVEARVRGLEQRLDREVKSIPSAEEVRALMEERVGFVVALTAAAERRVSEKSSEAKKFLADSEHLQATLGSRLKALEVLASQAHREAAQARLTAADTDARLSEAFSSAAVPSTAPSNASSRSSASPSSPSRVETARMEERSCHERVSRLEELIAHLESEIRSLGETRCECQARQAGRSFRGPVDEAEQRGHDGGGGGGGTHTKSPRRRDHNSAGVEKRREDESGGVSHPMSVTSTQNDSNAGINIRGESGSWIGLDEEQAFAVPGGVRMSSGDDNEHREGNSTTATEHSETPKASTTTVTIVALPHSREFRTTSTVNETGQECCEVESRREPLAPLPQPRASEQPSPSTTTMRTVTPRGVVESLPAAVVSGASSGYIATSESPHAGANAISHVPSASTVNMLTPPTTMSWTQPSARSSQPLKREYEGAASAGWSSSPSGAQSTRQQHHRPPRPFERPLTAPLPEYQQQRQQQPQQLLRASNESFSSPTWTQPPPEPLAALSSRKYAEVEVSGTSSSSGKELEYSSSPQSFAQATDDKHASVDATRGGHPEMGSAPGCGVGNGEQDLDEEEADEEQDRGVSLQKSPKRLETSASSSFFSSSASSSPNTSLVSSFVTRRAAARSPKGTTVSFVGDEEAVNRSHLKSTTTGTDIGYRDDDSCSADVLVNLHSSYDDNGDDDDDDDDENDDENEESSYWLHSQEFRDFSAPQTQEFQNPREKLSTKPLEKTTMSKTTTTGGIGANVKEGSETLQSNEHSFDEEGGLKADGEARTTDKGGKTNKKTKKVKKKASPVPRNSSSTISRVEEAHPTPTPPPSSQLRRTKAHVSETRQSNIHSSSSSPSDTLKPRLPISRSSFGTSARFESQKKTTSPKLASSLGTTTKTSKESSRRSTLSTVLTAASKLKRRVPPTPP